MWEPLDTEKIFLMCLHKNNNSAGKEFVGYNIFSSEILQASLHCVLPFLMWRNLGGAGTDLLDGE